MNRATLNRFWIDACRIGGNSSRLVIRGHPRINPHKTERPPRGGLSEAQSDIFDRSSDRCGLPLPSPPE